APCCEKACEGRRTGTSDVQGFFELFPPIGSRLGRRPRRRSVACNPLTCFGQLLRADPGRDRVSTIAEMSLAGRSMQLVGGTALAAMVGHARERTVALLEPVDDEQLAQQVSPLQ